MGCGAGAPAGRPWAYPESANARLSAAARATDGSVFMGVVFLKLSWAGELRRRRSGLSGPPPVLVWLPARAIAPAAEGTRRTSGEISRALAAVGAVGAGRTGRQISRTLANSARGAGGARREIRGALARHAQRLGGAGGGVGRALRGALGRGGGGERNRDEREGGERFHVTLDFDFLVSPASRRSGGSSGCAENSRGAENSLPVRDGAGPGQDEPGEIRDEFAASGAATIQSDANRVGNRPHRMVVDFGDRNVAAPTEGRHSCRPVLPYVHRHRYASDRVRSIDREIQALSTRRDVPSRSAMAWHAPRPRLHRRRAAAAVFDDDAQKVRLSSSVICRPRTFALPP